MDNKKLFLICAAIAIAGCDDSNSEPENLCNCDPETQVCIDNVCQDIEKKCDCKPGFVCIKEVCTPIRNDICDPECAPDTQMCLNNECKDIEPIDACNSKCDAETQKCVDKTCIFIEPWCQPGTCNEDRTEKCAQVENKPAGQYETCEPGSACFRGECVEGLAPACTIGQCNAETNSKCVDGDWVSCKTMEKCVDGECKLEETDCEPGTCIIGNANYYCNEEGKITECGNKKVCEEGTCVDMQEQPDLLWSLCDIRSDCSYGVCLKVIKLSSPDYTNVDTPIVSIPVQWIDSRIPEGKGICSDDCTLNSSACRDNTSNAWGTCMLAYVTPSPYIATDSDGNPIPYPLSLDQSRLATSTPYSALCRPFVSDHDKTYKESFCRACSTDADCNGYSCKDGMCLPECQDTNGCPMGFHCEIAENESTGLCIPPQSTCGDCIDVDKDGYGDGNCESSGVECNDAANDTYWQAPITCEEGIDRNCNGLDDGSEMLGTVDNCASCGDICQLGENANYMHKECINVANDGSETHIARSDLDPHNLDSWKFACKVTCDPGYADCNGDASDGCEVQIGNANEETSIVESATESGHIFALDADKDTYGDINSQNQIYCCTNDSKGVCYANAHTSYNPKIYWARVDLDELEKDCVETTVNPDTGETIETEIENCLAHQNIVENTDDCLDTKAEINPDAIEICDGIDNNCNGLEDDGIAHLYNPKTDVTYAPGEGQTDTLALGLNKPCYNYSNEGGQCGSQGIIECLGNERKLICKSPDNDGKDGYTVNNNVTTLELDGFDNDCDGLIDEDGMIPCLIIDKDFNPTTTPVVSNQGADRFVAYNTIGLSPDSSAYMTVANSYITKLKSLKDYNPDKSLSLCRIGILKTKEIIQSNTITRVEVCEPLYKPYSDVSPSRLYDYYGDAIDSNCDGYDYDLRKAIFIDGQDINAGAGNDATCTQLDKSNSKIVLPCKSLNKALTQAKLDSYNNYSDIIISTQKVEYTSDSRDPAFNLIMPAQTPYVQNYNNTKLLKINNKPILDLYTLHNELANRTAHESKFNAANYLFANEICTNEVTDSITGQTVCKTYEIDQSFEHPDPDASIRIYGGFVRDSNILNMWKKGISQTTVAYTVKFNNVTANSTYETTPSTPHNYIMFNYNYATGKKLSLYFENLNLEMSANQDLPETWLNGVTFTGINAYSGNINKIEFVNTKLNVIAPNGHSFAKTPTVRTPNYRYCPVGDSYCSGNFQYGEVWANNDDLQTVWLFGTGLSKYYSNYKYDYQTTHYQNCGETSNSGTSFTISFTTNSCSNYKIEGTTVSVPRYPGKGGVGGWAKNSDDWDHGTDSGSHNDGFAACDVDSSGRTSSTGEYYGTNARGGGAYWNIFDKYRNWADRGAYASICSNINSAAWGEFAGYPGYNGKSGSSGKIDKVTMEFKVNSNTGLYVDSNRSGAHGTLGQNGGGGGGGGIWSAWHEGGTGRATCLAGWGGNGGCAGIPGRAGGTGGSAIGVSLKSTSKDDIQHFYIDSKSSISVTNGSGGRAQSGGMGGSGTRGGWGVAECWGDSDKHENMCITTAGGPGGGGGGGGAGAGGRAGVAYPFVLTCADSTVADNDFISTSMNTIKNCGFDLILDTYTPDNFNTDTLINKKLVLQNANGKYYKDTTESYPATPISFIESRTNIYDKSISKAEDVEKSSDYTPKYYFHSDGNCYAEMNEHAGYITVWGSKGIVSSDEKGEDKSSLILVGNTYKKQLFKLIKVINSSTSTRNDMKLPLVK